MSMSPSNPSPAGAPSVTPNGTAQGARRPKQKTNPLVALRKPPRRPLKPQGTLSAPTVGKGSTPNGAPQPQANGTHANVKTPHASSEPAGVPQEFPLFTTRRSILEAQRYHIMKLFPIGKDRSDPTGTLPQKINFFDSSQWTAPIQLHRRDPRLPDGTNGGAPLENLKEDASATREEREKVELLKAERQRQREENQAQIAPSGGAGAGKTQRRPAFQKKTEQVFRAEEKDMTPKQRKAAQLRYEESVPWHLEDFADLVGTGGADRKTKQLWVGQYEAALSESHIALVMQDGSDDSVGVPGFFVIPVEKWYRFKEKPKFKAFSAKQREELANRKATPARWEVRDREEKAKWQQMLKMEGGVSNTAMIARSGERGDVTRGNQKSKHAVKGEGIPAGDEDHIDFDLEEEFADDEENGLFEGDAEDIKEAEGKMRKEMLAAKAFEKAEAKDMEEEERREKRMKEISKKLEKGTRKAILKCEHNFDYETDSDSNPYASSSESVDSEEERSKEAERKKEEEARLKAEMPASGASTKGTNTPSGRVSKQGLQALHKPPSAPSLKRERQSPNGSEMSGNESNRRKKQKKESSVLPLKRGRHSPHASEMSGNESTRKKQKKTHLQSASAAVSRPMSPAGTRQPSISGVKRRQGNAGSGSETDSVAGGRVRRLKVGKGASANGTPGTSGTPGVSRATSPAAPAAGSRPASPSAAVVVKKEGIPSDEEILNAIPKAGIKLLDLAYTLEPPYEIFSLPANRRKFLARLKKIASLVGNKMYLKGYEPAKVEGPPCGVENSKVEEPKKA